MITAWSNHIFLEKIDIKYDFENKLQSKLFQSDGYRYSDKSDFITLLDKLYQKNDFDYVIGHSMSQIKGATPCCA